MNIKMKSLLVWMSLALCMSSVGWTQAVGEPTTNTPEFRTIRGNDVVVAPSPTEEPVDGADTGLKFEEAPLADVVQVVMREVVKANYILHPPVVGTVTLSTQANISADYAMLLLEHALQANGLVMARDTRGTYHIGRPDVIKGMVPKIRLATPGKVLPPGMGAIIIDLKFFVY